MAKKQIPEWVKIKADKAQELSDQKRGRVRVIAKPQARVKVIPKIDPDASTAPDRSKGGRIPKYHPSFISIAERMSRNGHTDTEIAEYLGVVHSTVWRWATYHPKFKRALHTPADPEATFRIKKALQRTAEGFVDHNGTYHAPNFAAQRFWMRNKAKEEFPDSNRITGPNDGPIQQQLIEFDPTTLDGLTPEELLVLEKMLAKKRTASPASAMDAPDLRTKEEKHKRDLTDAAYYAKTVH